MILAFKLFLGLALVSIVWTVRGERSLTSSASDDQKTERETERTRYRREDSGPQMLTQAERIEFLATHNSIRNDISGVLNHPQPSAAGMMKMYWSAELEASALSWSMKCYTGLKHGQSEVVKLPEFLSFMSQYGTWIGQNLHKGGKSKGLNIIQAFAKETFHFTYNEGGGSLCVKGKMCGHYTQVVWQTSFLVGCGTAQCGDSYITTCNYMPGGNYAGSAPYKSGPACSLCASDTKYNFTECEGQLCVPKNRCSPVKECEVVDTANCLCSESSYNEIVSRLLKNAGAIHVCPTVVVFGLLLQLVTILLIPEAQSVFAPGLL